MDSPKRAGTAMVEGPVVNPRAFSTLLGQDDVADFLTQAITSDRVSHAYLFLGKPGSGKTDAAYAFARALLCDHGGCGSCETCVRVSRRTHPDVRYLAPEGAGGYMVEQIRDLVHDVPLAPVRSDRKVYIIDRADLLQSAPANAFLKTLEEPPGHVVFVLLGRNRSTVLPTILSRCQVVPFKMIPARLACSLLMDQTGFDERACRIALAAGASSLTRAREFLFSSAEQQIRLEALRTLDALEGAEDDEVLLIARSLGDTVTAPLEAVRSTHEQVIRDGQDYLGKAALASLEKQHKRELTAAKRRELDCLFNCIASWLRDCLMLAHDADEALIVNGDDPRLPELAARTDSAALMQALRHVDEARSLVAYNVTPQLVIEDLLFYLREVW